jgi:hypothetical protein
MSPTIKLCATAPGFAVKGVKISSRAPSGRTVLRTASGRLEECYPDQSADDERLQLALLGKPAPPFRERLRSALPW